MMILITGGSGSGKSAWAEDLAAALCPEEKWYLATMEPYGREAEQRILRHRRMRAEKGFHTQEASVRVADAMRTDRTFYPMILLESLSNLVANEMFSPSGRGGTRSLAEQEELREWILGDMKALANMSRDLIIVSDNVFEDGTIYEAETENYRRLLAEVHSCLTEQCDAVIEIVCGIPVFHRGRDSEHLTERLGEHKNTAWDDRMHRLIKSEKRGCGGKGNVMKLFVGGVWQGTETCAEKMVLEETGAQPKVISFSSYAAERQGSGSNGKAEVRPEMSNNAKEPEIWEGITPWIRDQLRQGKPAREEFLRILEDTHHSPVLVLQETGSGVVPLDPLERRFREENGRLCTDLAKTADEVYRVYCGILTRLK